MKRVVWWIMNVWKKWRDGKRDRRLAHENYMEQVRTRMESILTLNRKVFTATSTIGELYLDNEFICHTLEDTVRDPNKDGVLQKEEKVYGETAIPAGKYEIVVSHSRRFGRKLPLLLNVAHFKGVRIHPGNSDKDSSGCILVGKYDEGSPDWVSSSRTAFAKLMPRIEEAIIVRKLYIVIDGGPR